MTPSRIGKRGSPHVVAIIPAFNEQESLPQVIRQCGEDTPEIDVVVVNDGSTDQTSISARAGGVPVLDLPFNLGIGGAVQAGFLYALRNDYDIAIQVDADGQHPADQIPLLLEPILDGRADMVIGTRFLEEGGYRSSRLRRVGIALFAWLVSTIIGEKVTDTTSGFRAVNRRGIALFAADYPQDYPEVETQALAHRHGLRLMEVPVQMRERQGGESSIRMGGSAYYMIKVTLALLIGLFRRPVPVPDSGDRP